MKPSALFLALGLAAVVGGAADAHAFLDHASPRVGSSGPAPAKLQLWFTEGVVASVSRVSVIGPPGFGGAGPGISGADRSLVVALRPPVPPGTYRVHWRVVSSDTHITQGDFTFLVAP